MKLLRRLLLVCGAIAIVVAVLVTLSVISSDGLGLLDEDVDPMVAYFVTFALVFGDAVIPILPGETTLNTAAVLASTGHIEVLPVIVAGALGAVLGDSALYWLARLAAQRFQSQMESVQRDARVQRVLQIIGDRTPLLLVFGRYVPGLRFLVNATMGSTRFPYRRFLVWSAIGGISWAIYTVLLAYHVGSALEGFPLASIIVSGAITTVLIIAIIWLDSRKHALPASTSAQA
ncbi:MAG TPA: DedA family protein [Dehalococcoidia bacterium]|nr:DedA family protein [Dehalococcoidia bacterium]